MTPRPILRACQVDIVNLVGQFTLAKILLFRFFLRARKTDGANVNCTFPAKSRVVRFCVVDSFACLSKLSISLWLI